MLADRNRVSDLLPQDKPMIMVHGLIQHNETQSISLLEVGSENIFVNKNGCFTEPGIIENIAQTAALRSGYQDSLSGESPKVGFIGSIKNLIINRLPKVGETLETKVEVVSELANALVIKATSSIDNEIIAEGNLNIFIQE